MGRHAPMNDEIVMVQLRPAGSKPAPSTWPERDGIPD
jgi:hypothetical protein